jgi:hypothetical protein
MTKLEKLISQQSALTKQINDERKAESRARKEAAASLVASKRASFLRAAERAGLFDFDADLLAQEFKKLSEKLHDSHQIAPAEITTPEPLTFEDQE